MNWWLIIVAIVITAACLAGSFYFLVYFSSPDDRNQAWIPKAIVVLGIFISCCSVLLLPFDVANVTSLGDLTLEQLWQVVYMAIFGFVVGIVPFSIFYYEAQDAEKGIFHQLKTAIIFEFITCAAAALVIGLMYAFLGQAEIPYVAYYNTLNNVNVLESWNGPENSILTVNVSIVIYIIAMLSVFGWILFVFFGGTGLFALPLDMIFGFINRPKPMSQSDYARAKIEVRERAKELLTLGKEIEDKNRVGDVSRKTRKSYNAFRKAVYLLEMDFERLNMAYKDKGGSPILHFFTLVGGILGLAISICWVVHIGLYDIFVFNNPLNAPVYPFLNIMFIELDKVFGLFGTLAYSIFAFYLLLCVIKGNTKLGMRFLLISIHPMKVGNTLMNSFLFNTAMILLCSVTVTQFCAISFNMYARFTAVDAIFRTYVMNLKILHWFFYVYVYCLLGMSCLALIFLLIFPKDRKKDPNKGVDIELVMLQNEAKKSKENYDSRR